MPVAHCAMIPCGLRPHGDEGLCEDRRGEWAMKGGCQTIQRQQQRQSRGTWCQDQTRCLKQEEKRRGERPVEMVVELARLLIESIKKGWR